MCPSAGYMGTQELNIDWFVNPPEVQAARREGGSSSREKEGEALCLKKINKTLQWYARQSAREAEKTTFVLCFVRALSAALAMLWAQPGFVPLGPTPSTSLIVGGQTWPQVLLLKGISLGPVSVTSHLRLEVTHAPRSSMALLSYPKFLTEGGGQWRKASPTVGRQQYPLALESVSHWRRGGPERLSVGINHKCLGWNFHPKHQGHERYWSQGSGTGPGFGSAGGKE